MIYTRFKIAIIDIFEISHNIVIFYQLIKIFKIIEKMYKKTKKIIKIKFKIIKTKIKALTKIKVFKNYIKNKKMRVNKIIKTTPLEIL